MATIVRRLAIASIFACSLSASRDAFAQGGVTFTSYGTTCTFFADDARLGGAFDAATSEVVLTLSASQTCCNTFLQAQFLLFGVRQDPGLPLAIPGVVPGCVLSVAPVFFAVALPPGEGSFRFGVPALPPGLEIAVQGLDDYFTTIGFSHDLQFSNGLAMTTI